MGKWIYAVVFSACLAFPALAKAPTRTAVTGADMVEVAPKHYQFAALSKLAGSAVSLGVIEDDALDSGVTLLNLTVSNMGRRLIGLSPDEIKVSTDDGRPVAMLAHSQMSELVHKQLGGKRLGTGLGNFMMALSAASAGTTTSTTQYNGSISRFGGPPIAETSGTMTTTSVDPYAQARATQRARAYIEANNAKLKAAEDALDVQAQQMSFSSATVSPGEWKATLLPLEKLPAKVKFLTVAVTLGDDVHMFQLTLSGAARGWPVLTGAPPASMTTAGVNAWISDHIDQGGWAMVNADQTGVFFIGLKSLDAAPSGLPRVAVKREYYSPTHDLGVGVLSERSVWEVDCQQNKVRMDVLESHPDNNLKDLTIRQDLVNVPWLTPQPNTLIEKLGLQVCPASAGPAPPTG